MLTAHHKDQGSLSIGSSHVTQPIACVGISWPSSLCLVGTGTLGTGAKTLVLWLM